MESIRCSPAGLRLCLFLFYLGCIFYLSHQITLPVPSYPYIDKLYHALAYSGVGFLGGFWLTGFLKNMPFKKVLFWGMGIASFYGMTDEIHQYFVPGRSVEILDWLADTVGGGLGVLFYLKTFYVDASRR